MRPLLLLCLLAPGLVLGEIKISGWRPIAPQGELEGSSVALSYHTLHNVGGGGPSLPLQHYHHLADTSSLAQDLAGHDQCALYKVSFVQDLYFQYIQYKTPIPDLKEFTVCLWHKFYNHSNDHPLFSYAVPNQPRAILLWVSNTARSSYFSLSVESHTFFRLNYPLRLNRWYHSCTSWNSRTGEWQIWVNTERVGRGFHNRLVGHVIPGGGIAITGQEQRQFGGGFLEGHGAPKGSGGLLGEVTQLYLYKAALAAGKAHRDHKHHHGNHFSSTLPPPIPPSTGRPLPSHPLLIAGQLRPRLNIQAQLGGGPRLPNQPPPGNPALALLQRPGVLSGGSSTSSISLPGVSAFSIQHLPSGSQSSGVSLLGGSSSLLDSDSGSLLDLQHSLFKRDEDKDTTVAGQDTQDTQRKKRSTTSQKKMIPPKKYSSATEDKKHKDKVEEKKKSLSFGGRKHRSRINKRAIEFVDDSNGPYFEPHSASLIGGSGIGLLGGDFNPISAPQQQDDESLPEELTGGSSGDDGYPREPAEGEVMQVMNVCSGCAPEPFKKAEIISWRNTPKKLYSGALYTLANPECKRF